MDLITEEHTLLMKQFAKKSNLNLVAPLGQASSTGSSKNKETPLTTTWRCNQWKSDCSNFYKTNDSVSLTSNLQDKKKKKEGRRTSLVVQWLRLRAEGLDSIPGQGTRSHMLQLRTRAVKKINKYLRKKEARKERKKEERRKESRCL